MPIIDGHRIYIAMRWVLGGIFIAAGGTKLAEPEIFASLIGAYGILPDALVMPVAVLMPAAEVIAGVGLLGDNRGCLTVITILLLLFIAILGYGMWMGLNVDCGCFGPEDPEAAAFHGLRSAFFRDVAMLGGGGYLYWWRRYRNIRPASLVSYVVSLMKGV